MEARERQRDEMTVISSMFGEQVELDSDEDADDDGPIGFCVRVADAVLLVTLPALYPDEPPALTLSCPAAAAAAVAAAVQELESLASDAGGQECLAQIVQRFMELAEDSLAAAAAAMPVAAQAAAAKEEEEELIVRIDHMNDHASYMRSLERWAADGGLAGVLLYDESGKRVHGVVLVLQGGARAITAFLHRLRTELVDVDARGRRCRERQSTVLCRRPAGTHKEGQAPAAKLSGWRATSYESAQARDELLDQMGFLHVGSGAERFGSTQSKKS